jgi:hypothetical protein
MKDLKLERVSATHEVIHGSRRKTKTKMTVELLVRSDFERRTYVQEILWTPASRKIARVLDKDIRAAGDLPVQQKTRLARQVAAGVLGRPQE